MTRPRLLVVTAMTLMVSALGAAPAYAQGDEPAGGAALDQIVIATAGAVLLTAALLVLGIGHRTGRLSLLGRAGAVMERYTGIPGWASLPTALATASLLTAVFGMYWDISLHIDVGRDSGPLANPAHYFILAGLFGIFSAGFLAMVMPSERPSASAIELTERWYAPLGGVMVCACGAFSLLGFPLDDMWHRLFGQDVTLWGPTHLMLIGGAAMTLVGLAVLLTEGMRAGVAEGGGRSAPKWLLEVRRIALCGGFLIGLSTFQAEFDFGVPQFRFVFQPMLIMLAAAAALVATRVWLGRGSALGAVAFFLVVRGLLAVLVGPVLGQSTPHLPIYIVEAVIVELVALRVGSNRPLALGLWSGGLIGTVGLAAEWGWSHLWMPIPWPAELFPEGAVLGLGMALAGGLIGAWIGARLSAERLRRTASLRAAATVGAALVAVLVSYALYKPADSGVRAQVALTDVQSGPERTVAADVTLDPPNAAQGAEWLTVTAWQGDGLVVDRLEPVGPGRDRTTQPIPVNGNWKALVRLHQGDSLTAAPIFLPSDRALRTAEVPAQPRFTRELVDDHIILQREQQAAAPWLWGVAYGVVVLIALGLLVLLAWGLHRVAVVVEDRSGPSPAPRKTAARPAAGSPAAAAR